MIATNIGCEVTVTTELAIEVQLRDVIQNAKCSAMKRLDRIIRSASDPEGLIGSPLDFIIVKGNNKAEAMTSLQVAITSGGASARRIKITAKETEITPRVKITYGFTLFTLYNLLAKHYAPDYYTVSFLLI